MRVTHPTNMQGKFRTAMCMASQPGSVTVDGRPYLLTLFFCPFADVSRLLTSKCLLKRNSIRTAKDTLTYTSQPLSRAGWPFRPRKSGRANHGAPRHRSASTGNGPPSQAILVRRGHGRAVQSRLASLSNYYLQGSKSHQVRFPPLSYPRGIKAENPSWLLSV